MNVSNTVALTVLILCAELVEHVSNEVILCWECSTNSNRDCGNYDRIGDLQLVKMTTPCEPIGPLTRACYRTVIHHANDNRTAVELRLFCGPAIAHNTVCWMIGFLLIKLGGGNLTLSHCSVCALPLCNAAETLDTTPTAILITAWLISLKFYWRFAVS